MQGINGLNKQLTLKVGSQNPVKIKAATEALSQLYQESTIMTEGLNAPSLVSEQPMNERETRLGAENRLNFILQHYSCDFAMTMEGGVEQYDFGPATFAYVAIGHNGKISIGRSALLPLPNKVYGALQEGQELGDVMDQLFDTNNVKQKGGAIGLLTQGNATRGSIYTQALILAMAPFLHPHLYE